MNAKRILGSTIAIVAVAASAAVLAAPAGSKLGNKFDVYTDALRVDKPDPFTDGNKAGKFDPYTDGARIRDRDPFTDGSKTGKFDPYTDGTLHG